MSKEIDQAVDKKLANDHSPSHLFLVRIWPEENNGTIEWHGKVQHVLGDAVACFGDWLTLIDLFLSLMPPLHESTAGNEPTESSPSDPA